jgi:AraC-like DNA-binding protein
MANPSDAARGRDPREVGGAWTRFQVHSNASPAPELAPFVARYWMVDWDLRGEPPYRQLVVPYPNVNLTFFDGGPVVVRGVERRYAHRVLADAGRVFGVTFRPGCFRPFLGRPVSAITDRTLDAREVFGPGVPLAAMSRAGTDAERVAIVEDFLRGVLPARDPTAELLADTVARVATEPGIKTVEGLAARTGTGVRGLQRGFAGYVGVGPKWVIRRYRLHEITERLAAGQRIRWARLAADLGYADQAHLTRDFTAMFGEPPTRYAERYP